MQLAQFKRWLKQVFREFCQDTNYYDAVERTTFVSGFRHGLRGMLLYRLPIIAHMFGLILIAGVLRMFGESMI